MAGERIKYHTVECCEQFLFGKAGGGGQEKRDDWMVKAQLQPQWRQ